MPSYSVRRRRFLQSLGLGAGAFVLMPMVDSLMPTARGDDSSPKRILFFINSLGVKDEHQPTVEGGQVDLRGFSPLAPFQNELLVVKNFYNPFNLDLHGNRWFLTLQSSQNADKKSPPGGISFDRLLAQQLGAADPLASLALTVFRTKLAGKVFYTTHSSDGAGAAYPSLGPHDAFARIFGDVEGDGSSSAAAAQLRRDKSVLDHLTADIGRLNQRLAGPERERLQRYLESAQQLEKQLTSIADAQANCGDPLAPDSGLWDGLDRVQAQMDAAVDVAVMHLVCGLTKVVTFTSDGSVPYVGAGVGSHGMWHGDGTPAKHDNYYGHQATQIARIWQRLKDTPEGSGSFADNTTIVWLNQAGGGHHNSSYEGFSMVLGGGGAFKSGLVDLPISTIGSNDVRRTAANADPKRIPGSGAERSLADFLVTVAGPLGANIDSFGHAAINQGPITELYA